jgi:hypothetical protein
LALFVFPGHKIIGWKYIYIVNPVVFHEGLAGRWEPSWDWSGCCVLCLFPHPFLHVWYVERILYIWSPEEPFLSTSLSTQCHCHSILWHTGSHCIISSPATSYLFFIIPRK